jgi:DNA-binding transcriptional regulator YbjK
VNRRDQLLDAAIEVIGEQGIRALTHRAVDRAAGVPTGSTSNYFRTSDALLDAVVERFVVRERANFESIAMAVGPGDPDQLARAVTEFARDATGPHRTLTLARYAILVEAAIRPGLRPQLSESGARVNAWFISWMRRAGSQNPERDTPIVMNAYTGFVLHQLARPRPDFDPGDDFRTLIRSLIGEDVTAASARPEVP